MSGLVVIWIFFGLLLMFLGARKGDHPLTWFIAGVLLGPFALLLLPFAGKPCPFCRSRINSKATVCPKCQRDLPSILPEAVAQPQSGLDMGPVVRRPALRWPFKIALGVIGLLFIAALISENQKKKIPAAPVISIAPPSSLSQPPAPVPVKSSRPVSSKAFYPTPQPDRPSPLPGIRVTNVIIKKISGKHRYFFDIRNRGSKPFSGSVKITLINKMGRLGGETFDTMRPIEPGLGTSVHIDVYTGPPSVHGEYGLTSFEYVVMEGGKTVGSAMGAISPNIEYLN